jgi:hypothetical protein
MLIQMCIELIWWIEHQNFFTIGLVTLNKKVITYYYGLVVDVCLQHWFPIIDEETHVNSPKLQLI